MTRVGVLHTIPKQNIKALNGLANILHDRRNCTSKNQVKTMLIVFFDSQGIVHEEFVQESCIVNAEYYKGVLDRLILRIR